MKTPYSSWKNARKNYLESGNRVDQTDSRLYLVKCAVCVHLILGEAIFLDQLQRVPAGEVKADRIEGEGCHPLVCLRPNVFEERHEVHGNRRRQHRARLLKLGQGVNCG